MSIVDLLPAALAAWKPRRAALPPDVQFSHPIAVPRHPVTRSAVALPRNMASVARETQTVLTGVSGHARSRFVELQVAVEPGLVVQADPADYRMCLRDLLLAAIGHASGGVLITAMRQAGGVEITVLDDGIAVSDAQPDGLASGADDMFVPAGGTPAPAIARSAARRSGCTCPNRTAWRCRPMQMRTAKSRSTPGR